MKPGPLDPGEIRRFLDTFLYDEAAVLVDEIASVDPEAHAISAWLDTTRPLPFAREQRVDARHPAHAAFGDGHGPRVKPAELRIRILQRDFPANRERKGAKRRAEPRVGRCRGRQQCTARKG